MFNRQWFPIHSQYGLTKEALEFQNMLDMRSFRSAQDIIFNSFSSNRAYWKRQQYRLNHLVNRNPYSDVRVHFVSFWPTFNLFNNQLLDFFRASVPDVTFTPVTQPVEADVIVYSCYPSLPSTAIFPHAKSFLFLGENVRPYFHDYDVSLTFDMDSFRGRNIHMPLWLFEIDWFNKPYPDRPRLFSETEFYSSQVPSVSKLKRILFVGNNEEPYRCSVLQNLISSGAPLDLYGSHIRPVVDKHSLYKKYKIVFCPENSYHPGYVTEKLIHGFLSESYYAYRGCLRDSILNVTNFHLQLDSLSSSDSASLILKYLDTDLPSFRLPLFSPRTLHGFYAELLAQLRPHFLEFLPL
jgi:hypothetical protein